MSLRILDDKMNVQRMMLTQLLRVRLAHMAVVDVNISLLETLFKPSKLESHFGHIIGCFVPRLGRWDHYFVSLVRSQPFGLIDQLVFFYVNKPFFKVPRDDKYPLIRRLTKDNPKEILIKIKTELPKICDASALLEGVCTYFTYRHFCDGRSYYEINLHSLISPIKYQMAGTQSECNVTASPQDVVELWNLLLTNGRAHDVDLSRRESLAQKDFHLLRILFDHHFYYGVNFPQEDFFLLIICHDNKFESRDQYNLFLQRLARFFGPHRPKTIGVSRFRSSPGIGCESKFILQACTELCKFPLLVIKKLDVEGILYGEGLENLSRLSYLASQSQDELELPYLSESDESTLEPDEAAVKVYRIIEYNSQSDSSKILSVDSAGSNLQSIPSHREQCLDTEVNIVSSQLSVVNEPTTCNLLIEPRDDPEGKLLLNVGHFLRRLYRLVGMFDDESITDILGAFTWEEFASEPLVARPEARFVFIPIVDTVAFLVVTDNSRRVWTYLNPDTRQPTYDESYERINVVFRNHEVLKDFNGTKTGLSSTFHREYALMHLLVAVRELIKAYNMAGVVPIRLIYQETDFRRFCYECCLEQELVNLEYNKKNNLIDRRGMLLPGAYRHGTCPVYYTASVVKSDQCPYCGKRGFKHLKAHIIMKHAGNALKARLARRDKEAGT